MANYSINRIDYSPESAQALAQLLQIKAAKRGEPYRYFIQTFGCQQNESDSEKLAGMLEEIGFTPVSGYEQADLVLINTCSIRENADQRLFGHLGELKALRREKPDLVVGVCGCLPTQDQQREKIKKSFSYVNLLLGPQNLQDLPQLLLSLYQGEKKRAESVSQDNIVCEELPLSRTRSYRALVSIMYGCNNFCSYCMVPLSRARERSRQPQDILEECRKIAAAGIPEVMLLGQNVNSWGFDFPGQGRKPSRDILAYDTSTIAFLESIRRGENRDKITSFPRLLTAISALPGIRSVRYMSPHPRDFDGEMLAALKVSPEIENHIHLPAQSGSDKVLQVMNRHHTRQQYLNLVDGLRRVRPDISITTDIIVGFPTEEEEDFQDTLNLVNEVRFAGAFTFIYSPRPGTPATELTPVDAATQHDRFDRLSRLIDDYSLKEHTAIVGTKRSVLLEGCSKQNPRILTGRDREFHLINIQIPPEINLPEDAQDEQGNLNSSFFEGRFAEVLIKTAKIHSLEADYLG